MSAMGCKNSLNWLATASAAPELDLSASFMRASYIVSNRAASTKTKSSSQELRHPALNVMSFLSLGKPHFDL
eukprot:9190916-Pyramimonas_sp.AAC.1